MTGSSAFRSAVDRLCADWSVRRQKVHDIALSINHDKSATRLEKAAGCLLALADLFEAMGPTRSDRTMIVDALLGPIHRELKRKEAKSESEKP